MPKTADSDAPHGNRTHGSEATYLVKMSEDLNGRARTEATLEDQSYVDFIRDAMERHIAFCQRRRK